MEVQEHFDRIAKEYDQGKTRHGGIYYDTIKGFYAAHIPRAQAVLEMGCGTGDILASTHPAYGVGVDVSGEMIERARAKHPHLTFHQGDAGKIRFFRDFDAAILCDVIEHTRDHAALVETARVSLKDGGILCVTTVNPRWAWFVHAVGRMGLKLPEGPHWWPPVKYIEYLCWSKGFELIAKETILGFIAGRVFRK